jgi:Sec-independent protein translocase protein TatA
MARGLSKSNSSMRKGIFLLLILIALVVFTQRLPQIVKVVGAGLGSKALHSYGQRDISEIQQDSLRKTIAGFWAWDGERSDSTTSVLTDRIELKDNGILWQVQQRTLYLPSGDSTTITAIRQAFVAPFYWVDRDSGILLCEIRVLKAVRIIGSDTCYMKTEEKMKDVLKGDSSFFAPTMVPVWLLKADGTRFIWEGRNYRAWDTADIARFFPVGTLALVDEIHLEQCSIRKTDRGIMRELIAGDLSRIPLTTRNSDDVVALMGGYYLPYCLKQALENPGYPGTFMTEKVSFSMVVNSLGKVDTVSVDLRNIQSNKWERSQIENEIRQWLFQPLSVQAPPLSLSGEMIFGADSTGGVGRYEIRAVGRGGEK